MILVKGKAGKGEGGKEVFPFFSLPLFPTLHPHPPPTPTNECAALKTNNLETIVALKGFRPRRLRLPLSLSHCSCIYPLLFSSGME